MARKKREKTKRTKAEKTISLYKLAENKPGKKFTLKQYRELCGSEETRNAKKGVKLKNGQTIGVDSRPEYLLANKLIASGNIKELNTQCLRIDYRYKGEIHSYYPDFVIFTKTKKIMIIEVKVLTDMLTRQNNRKYDELGKFCKKNGYLYAMMDKNLRTRESLPKLHVSSTVKEAVETAIDGKGRFTYEDFKNLARGKRKETVASYKDMLAAYVAQRKGRLIQHESLTHASKMFRITLLSPKERNDEWVGTVKINRKINFAMLNEKLNNGSVPKHAIESLRELFRERSSAEEDEEGDGEHNPNK